MKNQKNFLLLKPGGDYPYGVVAFPKNDNHFTELHGPFDSEQKARDYIFALREEYEDYLRFQVCRIEIPSVGPSIMAFKKDVRGDMLYRQDAKP